MKENSLKTGKKKLLILGLLLVVMLGALAVVNNMPDNKKENEGTVTSDSSVTNEVFEDVIYSVNYDSINLITVTASGQSFSLEKKDGNWISPSNPDTKISQSAASGLAVGLCSLMYRDIMDDTVSLADCGISDSSDRVSFMSEIGETVIQKGITVPGTDSDPLVYVKVSNDDHIYMVSAGRIERFFQTFADYRSDSIKRVDYDNVTSLYIKNVNGEFSLYKSEADTQNSVYNEWKMEKPVLCTAYDSNINDKLIGYVRDMSISSCVSDSGDFGNYGLGDKKYLVTLTDSTGDSQTIYFSDMTDGRYYIAINDEPQIYTLEAEGFIFPSVKTIDLIDRHICLINRELLSSIDIKGNGYDYTIDFTEGGTTKVNGKEIADTTDRLKIFETVCGMLADDVSAVPVNKAEVTITYNRKDGVPVKVAFETAENSRFFNVSVDGKSLYVISKTKLDSIKELLDGYLKK